MSRGRACASRTTAIDLFAGGGGFTCAAEAAGVRVLWAANHSPLAVDIHRRNHPNVVHVCQDLHQARWLDVPAPDLLLASPCCQGHTPARGPDRPHHDASRSTAWAVVSALECLRPAAFIVENVDGFLRWALYPSWADALRRLGYSLSVNIIDAADCPMDDGLGVPQHRVRLYIVGVRATVPLEIRPPHAEHRPASSFLRFDDAAGWSLVEKPGRAAATLARVKAGRARFGDRFLAPYYGSGSGLGGRSIHRPCGVFTCLARWMAVDGDRCRMVSAREAAVAQGFPADYVLPATEREGNALVGNAVAVPAAAYVIREVLRAA